MQRSKGLFESVVRFVVIFAIARIAVGVATIVFFDREAFAWGIEITILVAVAAIIYVLVALLVRRATRPVS
jgi:hypothetical protein